MSLAGFEPTISAGERLQAHILDSAASATGELESTYMKFWKLLNNRLKPRGIKPFCI
jgi:hypothetical protein